MKYNDENKRKRDGDGKQSPRQGQDAKRQGLIETVGSKLTQFRHKHRGDRPFKSIRRAFVEAMTKDPNRDRSRHVSDDQKALNAGKKILFDIVDILNQQQAKADRGEAKDPNLSLTAQLEARSTGELGLISLAAEHEIEGLQDDIKLFSGADGVPDKVADDEKTLADVMAVFKATTAEVVGRHADSESSLSHDGKPPLGWMQAAPTDEQINTLVDQLSTRPISFNDLMDLKPASVESLVSKLSDHDLVNLAGDIRQAQSANDANYQNIKGRLADVMKQEKQAMPSKEGAGQWQRVEPKQEVAQHKKALVQALRDSISIKTKISAVNDVVTATVEKKVHSRIQK